MTDMSIRRIERLALRVEPRRWAFADERRAEIDAHFEALKRDKPLWNGRVLLMCNHAVQGQTLEGAYLETDFASFISWRDWGCPEAGVLNCFAQAALQGADGAYVLALMGPRTANAGKIYFPSGTPEPGDVVAGSVDMESSVRRELFEETGLSENDVEIDPGWYVVFAGPRIALMKPMRARETAEVLRERIRRHIAADSAAELADAYVARGPGDIVPAMLPFVTEFLTDRWKSPVQRSGEG